MISNPLEILRLSEPSDFFLFHSSQIKSNNILYTGDTSFCPSTEGGATWANTGQPEVLISENPGIRLGGGTVGNKHSKSSSWANDDMLKY